MSRSARRRRRCAGRVTGSRCGPRAIACSSSERLAALFEATCGRRPVVRGDLRVRGVAVATAAREGIVAGRRLDPPLPPRWTALDYVTWSARLAGHARRAMRARSPKRRSRSCSSERWRQSARSSRAARPARRRARRGDRDRRGGDRRRRSARDAPRGDRADLGEDPRASARGPRVDRHWRRVCRSRRRSR